MPTIEPDETNPEALRRGDCTLLLAQIPRDLPASVSGDRLREGAATATGAEGVREGGADVEGAGRHSAISDVAGFLERIERLGAAVYRGQANAEWWVSCSPMPRIVSEPMDVTRGISYLLVAYTPRFERSSIRRETLAVPHMYHARSAAWREDTPDGLYGSRSAGKSAGRRQRSAFRLCVRPAGRCQSTHRAPPRCGGATSRESGSTK